MSRWIPVVGAIVVLGSMVLAEDEAPRTFGWRGNWTGLHPSAQVPAEWSNISTGPVQSMKCATTRLASDGVSAPAERSHGSDTFCDPGDELRSSLGRSLQWCACDADGQSA